MEDRRLGPPVAVSRPLFRRPRGPQGPDTPLGTAATAVRPAVPALGLLKTGPFSTVAGGAFLVVGQPPRRLVATVVGPHQPPRLREVGLFGPRHIRPP